MAPIPIIAPTIVRHTMQHQGRSGQPWDCVLDINLDELGTTRHDAVAELVPKVVGAWQDNICSHIPNSDNFTGCRWIDLDSLGGTSGQQGPIAGKPVHGGTGVAWAPPNVNVLIHKQCAHNRKQRNGRMYIPAVDEGSVDDGGLLAGSFITLWTTQVGALNTAIDNLTIGGLSGFTKWRVVHVESHTPPPNPKPNSWSSSDINSFSVDGRAATQRRRLR